MIERKSCLIVIPAYNASLTLGKLLEELINTEEKERILVVDDGSTDRTQEVAKEFKVLYLGLKSNQGKGAALFRGIQEASQRGFAWVITMDADGQHSPRDLSHFYRAKVLPKTGVIVGTRRIKGTRMPIHRRFSNWSTSQAISFLARQKVGDCQSGYRMYLVRAMLHSKIPKQGRFEWEARVLVLLSRLSWRIERVDIETLYGDFSSHMRIIKDTLRFIRMYCKLFLELKK